MRASLKKTGPIARHSERQGRHDSDASPALSDAFQNLSLSFRLGEVNKSPSRVCRVGSILRPHQPERPRPVRRRSWLDRRSRSARQVHADRGSITPHPSRERTVGVVAEDRETRDARPLGHRRSGVQAGTIANCGELEGLSRVWA